MFWYVRTEVADWSFDPPFTIGPLYIPNKSMARKIYDPSENENSLSTEQGAEQIVDSQLQTQSRELYANFVREEIQLQGLPVPHVPSLVFFTLHDVFAMLIRQHSTQARYHSV